MTNEVVLRNVVDDDIPIFFQQQLDPDANYMAAFTAKEPGNWDRFAAHWAKIRSDASTTNNTIVSEGNVVGYIAQFEQFGHPEVGFWIGKEYWGKGLTTRALAQFLERVETRPLYARSAKDNVASIRVLEKCGFVKCGEDKGFANARNAEVEEFIFKLGG